MIEPEFYGDCSYVCSENLSLRLGLRHSDHTCYCLLSPVTSVTRAAQHTRSVTLAMSRVILHSRVNHVTSHG